MNEAKFYSMLHEREMTTEKLAALIGSSRARVTDAINNRPTQGKHTRTRLRLVLTLPEQRELGWIEAEPQDVPRETFPAEQGVPRSGEVGEELRNLPRQ